MNRLNKIDLPTDQKEASALIKEYLFGSVSLFMSEDVTVVRPEFGASCSTYAVIDAMYKPDISIFLDAYDTEWECLWKGESQEHFELFAPYIVKVTPDTQFSEWLLESGWGKEWGIYLRSYLPLSKLTHHLRKFNQIYNEIDERWVMFRYYAPVTVKTFIPFMSASDFAEFTDGITQIISEDPEQRRLLVI
ncbi:DUF4123 domain-containing protein [Budvicia aquatica]|uniref:DUF4123 domain-containing protein n=1 Tax=Budvicia aquatica TaxID=82979 RepID=A0A2C6DSB3_9GAMM|nr:DUF4123 domain-containing protein [Budvicia aquatica]PHI31701.1 DUF4123 domain-containing protein [Budvicia aquatica]VFS52499.1 Uncharacterised protein [Budvicia aquatica]